MSASAQDLTVARAGGSMTSGVVSLSKSEPGWIDGALLVVEACCLSKPPSPLGMAHHPTTPVCASDHMQ
eukprot:6057068-Amphidinium_carterae.1